MIICHNVLEYAQDREDIVRQFARVLKTDGKISIVKHNRAGRVMQMVVLLNDFEHAHSLLDGNDRMTSSMELFIIMRMQILRNGVGTCDYEDTWYENLLGYATKSGDS